MKTNRLRAVFVWALLVFQTAVLLLFAGQKKGFFVDEIYSWGLANSYYKPDVALYDVFDHWITGEEFNDYITVRPDQRFAYGSVYYNQTQDVHPPLFYMLLHTVSSLTPGRFSKWQAVAVNLLFYMGCLYLLYKTAALLLDGDGYAAAAMLLWGLSPGGLSTGIFARMYMMMTFFTMAGVYTFVKLLLDGQTAKRLVALAAVTFLGLLTQYYFVFLAFFLSGFYVLWKLYERKWKEAAVFAVVMLGAVGAMVLCFPACIAHLTRPDNFVAEETGRNLTTFAAVPTNLIAFISSINMDFLGGRIRETAAVAAVAFAGGLLYRWRRKKRGGTPVYPADRKTVTVLGLTAACILSFLCIVVVAVVPGARYLYNLYPVMAVLGVWWAVHLTDWCLCGRKAAPVYAAMLLGMGFLYGTGYGRGCVQYLYPENEARVRAASENSGCYCLYVTDYRNAPLTQDLLELSGYRGIYISSAGHLDRLPVILAEKGTVDSLVVYVDTNDFWSSGYDDARVLEQIKKETGYHESRFLYENELSKAFLLE